MVSMAVCQLPSMPLDARHFQPPFLKQPANCPRLVARIASECVRTKVGATTTSVTGSAVKEVSSEGVCTNAHMSSLLHTED